MSKLVFHNIVKKGEMLNARAVSYWVLAGVMEGPFVLALAHYEQWILNHLYLSLVSHIMGSICLFFALPRGKGWLHPQRYWSRTFSILSFILPFFGWLLCGVILFLYRAPKSYEEMDMYVLPVKPDMFDFHAYGQRGTLEERVLREVDFIPLADILKGEDSDLKRGAIERLSKLKTPEAIQFMLDLRSDSSSEVRFYVTSALTKIKKEYEEQLEAAKNSLLQDDYQVSARIFLAEIYLQYAKSHLLDDVTAKHYTQESLYHLKEAVLIAPDHLEAYLAIIEIYSLRQNWDAALGTLDILSSQKLLDDEQIVKKKIEIYFEQGHMEKLQKSITSFDTFKEPAWQALARWWDVPSQ